MNKEALPFLRAGLDGGGGKVVGETLFLVAAVDFSTWGAKSEVVTPCFNGLSFLLMDCPSDEEADLSTLGFVFEKSNVKLVSRKERAVKRNTVFNNPLSFSSILVASRWGFNAVTKGA